MKIDLARLLVAGFRDPLRRAEPIPRPTEAEVIDFETQIGSSLPGDYRQFLLTTNGGFINRAVVPCVVHNVYPLLDVGERSSGSEVIDLGDFFTLYKGMAEVLTINSDYGLTLLSAHEAYTSLGDAGYLHVPPDCIPIANVHDSGYLLLALDGVYKNSVLYYGYNEYEDPDELYGNVRLAGKSFTDFVNSLYTA